jgi:hypothetical protein
MRFTSTRHGRSVTYDLNGTATIQYFRDDGTRLYLRGAAAVGFAPTDPYPAGFYRLTGFHGIYTAPERAVRRMVVDAGDEHDICDDLVWWHGSPDRLASGHGEEHKEATKDLQRAYEAEIFRLQTELVTMQSGSGRPAPGSW